MLDAIIVGAGFSGLYQLYCLREQLGLKVRVLEAADGVGGTWYWNRYPGARCDSESHSYCYFFSKELLEEWEWSERYPGHAEILRYLNHVADRFSLRPDISLNTKVTAARFDEAARRWVISTEGGETLTARFLVTGVGCLSTANVPDIPGRDDFAGEWYHTGQWPHEGVDFSGKRVGQIGTGSTGIQAVPVIAETAEHLTVFQRTANFSVPARNAPLSDEFKAYVRENHEATYAMTQASLNGHCFQMQDRSALEVSAEDREALYEAAWQKGGLEFRATFEDLLRSKPANDTAVDFIQRKIRGVVEDAGTAQTLANIDHPYATKRPPIDSQYFEAYNRPNVSLVDLRKTPIERISQRGVVVGGVTGGDVGEVEHPLDIIVFATGFDAMTGALLRMNITGRDGVALKDAWSEGPRTYLGLQVAGFPNLFTITGPGSPSVLSNMPVAIEQHVNFITACIAHMETAGHELIEATEDAAQAWVTEVNDIANATLLPQAGHSWYLGANVPGKPRVFMPYAGGLPRYRESCERAVAAGYEGFELS